MGEQIKNMLVGLLMIAACAFTISLILFLKPSVGDGKKTYTVRFSNINGIGVGTRVMFAGKPVGEVVSVKEISEARKSKADKEGHIYFYQLKLKLDSSVTIYNTDAVGIQTSGLLGEKSIAIVPNVPAKGLVQKPIGNEPIYAQSTDPLEMAFNELSSLADEMEGTFKYLNKWLNAHGEMMADSLHSFKATMDQAEKALQTINESGLIHSAKNGIDHFSDVMGDISSGKGTIGKLVTDDNMYLQLSAILSKGNTMMNDINQYGVLFHLNKSWQRQRLQRSKFIDALDTPLSFKNYFQNEVDDINMAMARLSMVIERAGSSQNRTKILHDKQFSKDFASLLKEVEQMASNLKLYNEQLEDVSQKCN
jgi:phospholipid/cholesterol/gamma-HCH transport system substrate-binding protein